MIYTTPLKEKVETVDNRDPVDFINEVISHAQAHFCLVESLGTRIKLEVFPLHINVTVLLICY